MSQVNSHMVSMVETLSYSARFGELAEYYESTLSGSGTDAEILALVELERYHLVRGFGSDLDKSPKARIARAICAHRMCRHDDAVRTIGDSEAGAIDQATLELLVLMYAGGNQDMVDKRMASLHSRAWPSSMAFPRFVQFVVGDLSLTALGVEAIDEIFSFDIGGMFFSTLSGQPSLTFRDVKLLGPIAAKHPKFMLTFVDLLIRSDKLAMALAALIQYESEDTARPSTWLVTAALHAETNNLSGAIEACDHALNLSPAWPYALALKAHYMILNGDASGARAVVDRIPKYVNLQEEFSGLESAKLKRNWLT